MVMSMEKNEKLILRDYQRSMIKWMLATPRNINKDWPGLGKTLEAAEATYKFPCLVICRKHAIRQWEEFLQTQYPHQSVVACVGTRTQRQKLLNSEADWYIINHAMLATYHLPVHVQTVIGDEAQAFRNRNSDQTRAMYHYVNEMLDDARVHLLTANPAWKSADDVWSLVNILYPAIVPPYREFVQMFMVTDSSPYGVRVLGVKRSMRRQLERILTPIAFGRTSKDVGRELPPTIETVVNLDFPKQIQDFYDETKRKYRMLLEDEDGDELRIDLSSSAIIHTLRKITAFAGKIDAICQIVEDNRKPTLIGVWYKEFARAIYDKLGKHQCYLITGETDALIRQKIAQRAAREGKHVVATEASMTDSVNLQDFRQVIFGEEHYAPGANYQFLSRVVRDRNDDGRDRDPVLVYYVHVRKTIDKVIHNVTTRRQGGIKEILAGSLV